ncbi:hypothetical protein HYW17_00640 [Candidatus Uhrbacteria bacterium]|nr:hypothetical protein [Candidatus Uhrbacteria bacterium]
MSSSSGGREGEAEGERDRMGERHEDGGANDGCIPATYFLDNDGDGYGAPMQNLEGCMKPKGYATNADDCDDGNENIYPGAEELCDGLDNDCNREIDDGLTAPSQECFAGRGECRRAGLEYQVCEGAAGWSTDYRNCDASAGEAAAELCDGLDNDCDETNDNNLTRPSRECYISVAGCRRPGMEYRACEGAAGWSAQYQNCEADALSEEVCDALDNDCDGFIDNHCAREISAGYRATCMTLGDTSVRCWGYNGLGQLGDGTNTERHTPTPVSGLRGAVGISLGQHHACALLEEGSVRCWGANSYGQLGDGTSTDSSVVPIAAVSGVGSAVQLSAGFHHTCAVLENGSARCWGKNENGQLGNGTNNDGGPTPPVTVSGLAGIIQISGGENHTCAVSADGSAYCWGRDQYGRLGTGSSDYPDPHTPALISTLSDVAQISAGMWHTCAVSADGSAYCWGANPYGQLGNGSAYLFRPSDSTPGLVSELEDASQITAGDEHTCALLGDGSARCWGYNIAGRLGDGTVIDRYTPVAVFGLSDAVRLSTGSAHTCAVLEDGSARCWGNNSYGQLGDGTTQSRTTPVEVVWTE